MIKVKVVCVGKVKEKYFSQAIDEYSKRLSRFCSFEIIEVDEASKTQNLEKKSEIEGELLLSKCKGVIVALDSRGKMLSSPEIADFIKKNCL